MIWDVYHLLLSPVLSWKELKTWRASGCKPKITQRRSPWAPSQGKNWNVYRLRMSNQQDIAPPPPPPPKKKKKKKKKHREILGQIWVKIGIPLLLIITHSLTVSHSRNIMAASPIIYQAVATIRSRMITCVSGYSPEITKGENLTMHRERMSNF